MDILSACILALPFLIAIDCVALGPIITQSIDFGLTFAATSGQTSVLNALGTIMSFPSTMVDGLMLVFEGISRVKI